MMSWRAREVEVGKEDDGVDWVEVQFQMGKSL